MGALPASLRLPLATLAVVAGALHPDLSFDEDDSATCIRYHRPGKLLFYKDTVVNPIGISIPASLVADDVPTKHRVVADFVGSRKGGDTSEYRFGPLDEERYRGFYARHRFADTWKKGGWDALRHAEILAAGTVPIFRGLDEASPFLVPFLPADQLIEAERQLLPYSRALERVYNATVRSLLWHTRCCLTSESMAARLLRTLGLWPTERPLKLLYVACGWGFASLDDGWQGPVSIGLFLGLHSLLRRHPGSRIVDVPLIKADFLTEHTHRSHFWYTFQRDEGCRFTEENLRRLMYGYGFSYARQLPREGMATEAEREGVLEALRRQEFDAVIYGKVGPTQGCDPLPFMEDVQNAGYPPQRVALVYGGDFGLANRNVSTHMRLMGEFGTIFVREIDAPVDSRFSWRPKSVLPTTCFVDTAWRSFFKLWYMRLRCWGCGDIDDAVVGALWPLLRRAVDGPAFGFASPRWPRPEPCWSGLALLSFALLARGEGPKEERCDWAAQRLQALSARIAAAGGPAEAARLEDDFLEAFGVRPVEVYAFVCDACEAGALGGGGTTAICASVAELPSPLRVVFAANFDSEPERSPLDELRNAAALRNHLAGA